MIKKLTLVSLLIAAPALTANVWAVDEFNFSSGLTTSGSPLGLHGADTVKLAKHNKHVLGSAKYAAVHEGGTYYFSSEKNKQTFEANPDKFLPQFGGFCAYAVSLGKKFDGDPRFADIVDGKLYVFVNEDILNAFKKDKQGVLNKAKKTWPGIEHEAAINL